MIIVALNWTDNFRLAWGMHILSFFFMAKPPKTGLGGCIDRSGKNRLCASIDATIGPDQTAIYCFSALDIAAVGFQIAENSLIYWSVKRSL